MILHALGVAFFSAMIWICLRLELARIRAKKAQPAETYSIVKGNVAKSACREGGADANATCVEGTGLDT